MLVMNRAVLLQVNIAVHDMVSLIPKFDYILTYVRSLFTFSIFEPIRMGIQNQIKGNKSTLFFIGPNFQNSNFEIGETTG